MNIYVMKISENKTKVSVHARYIITDNAGNTRTVETGDYIKYNTTNSAKGTPPYRIICPTYKAENAIINALK